ncbi:RNA polymerase sigma-70 factor, ECF subfamily [Pedobacter sp. ok626]|uniref:RNA polymerase sigma factor n=1 Tax=Pedobacter sp. ok626 TaxID=1761882 RepID=UPI00088B791C|nr:RNA polymerase sigma-70 factor [Pedobacter sp. ok626]SDK64192.1 RNA polymerase sigma-70 factor, ECF subfamily [Pedobacter sp. ok626]
MSSKNNTEIEHGGKEAFHKDDENLLRYFFDLHHKSLRYFAIGLVSNDAEAEDIVASCFVKLWQFREQYSDPTKIKAFLYISCRNACLDYLKKNKRRNGWQDEYLRQLEGDDERILQRAAESAYLDIINREIEELPEKCAEVFKLLYFEHKTTDEIANQLNISVKTVRNHKARAVKQLRYAFVEKGLSDAMMFAVILFLNSK